MTVRASTSTTLSELDSRFAACDLAHLQTLGPWRGQSATCGNQLWEAPSLDFIVDRYLQEYGAADRRALLSHWSKSYLEALLPGALAACLLLDRQLPLRFDALGLQLDAEGSVANILLPAGTLILPDDADLYRRCQALLETNLEPFVEALARHARISKRALWGNVAAYIAWALRLLVERCGLPAARLNQAMQLFSAPAFPDGRPNPVQRAYQFPESPQDQPWRRVCCLRYCLPELPYCADCPLVRQKLEGRREKAP
jgi:ferric iron reductase protein FhuF